MPGSRLTHEERQRIALWLAEGVGYAEMGRRLNRPTSTISREVARNSRSGGYLADRAQQAAATRARRRRTTQPEPPSSADEREREFVEEFAVLLSGTGLQRMASRVFASLLTADADGLTAADLVKRLRISPASVSKSIGYLETMELVGRTSDSGRRRERYTVHEDVWLRAWQADTSAHADVAKATRRGLELFGADTPAGVRLAQMGRFFARLSEQMHGSSSLTDAAVRDALTVIAALVHGARALTLDELATPLGWPRERVAEALDAIDRHPALADPLMLRAGSGAYTMEPRPDRLTAAQRDALQARLEQHQPSASRP
ncbi:MarR family transcriptional regulator [Nonomuraea mesophila]|uniref:MarR family transcriptional regulator n=1 Tax=Nonomuraea mesophila TaxID=2530382 RepID=A0A4R5FWQ9_9ACTN|nr:helix-turn-helix domain-containing protein [Nonomuraea mesophila]TDE58818.1 MarR family transcriptional regulator [Nonomuraea mesophila]